MPMLIIMAAPARISAGFGSLVVPAIGRPQDFARERDRFRPDVKFWRPGASV
jgi:hypothetical protein